MQSLVGQKQMEKQIKNILKVIKMNESSISTFMGAAVVIVIALFMLNYFKSLNLSQLSIKPLLESGKNVDLQENINEDKGLPTTYKVQKGDDLWHISEKFYKSGYNYVDIAKENKIANPSIIVVDMELTIPKVEAKLATVPQTENKFESGAKVADKAEYTVVKGDSLWQIAIKTYGDGYAWTKIYEANKKAIGANPNEIEKGMVLALPELTKK